ncbi:YfgM family protein [Fangia hongkongensis]|uniref:YfgM family protein n=1 Tax=Fangia hongkongensis TaxID=270495 RepID=UPI000363B804|nr:tetratricopeptide repeat protein [Fangia hongkongensis]MBK2125571.1 tetratricopeptide repeat protein [Fangia hongkongensis]
MSDKIDNEEFDRFKRLWKKHGAKVLGIVCIIFIAIIALQYWNKRTLENNLEAANLYQNLAVVIESSPNNTSAITAQANNIINLYPESIYSDFARFILAKNMISDNKLSQAETVLAKIITDSKNKSLAAIASVRLARIQISQNNPTAAVVTLNNIKLAGFELSKEMILGNAYFALKQYADAKVAWEKALKHADKPELKNINTLLKMKLDSLNVYLANHSDKQHSQEK